MRDGTLMPRQRLEGVGVDTAREELVGVARVAREQPLQILRGQISGIGVKEILETGGAGAPAIQGLCFTSQGLRLRAENAQFAANHGEHVERKL